MGSYLWSWHLAQLSVMPRNALAVCSTVSSSQTLRLNLYQLRTRNPVARRELMSPGLASSAASMATIIRS